MQDKLSLFKANAFKSPSRCDSEFTKAQNARYKISAPFQVQYPISALRDKKEGFVNMEFDLSQDGIPININIIESYPERMFNRESERNLSRARYELKSAGISTNNTCLSVQLNYFLQDKT
ncbi:TonB family protein [Shewanella sp. SR44-3]|uniref:TonB family protein n=1 Tax=Shewanella sp. SR44-3 TaxID=2760936 RepID=UPI0015F8E593|nr:TonB family protein [Shewanella sp. SR44-3]MBB1270100.1 TonB family protein [Shewanella sp. SR44-3]